ncbi:MAG: phosphoribosylglycinamide formyltransferase [Cyclobacteriaceae bacterium]|nr:phosphoribosylglycinamide formyltransferase [Cyclobacteriaceae bacterium]
MSKKVNIAIFASGSGTNAQAILEYFQKIDWVDIKCIYSNNCEAYVLKRAQNFGKETLTFSREEYYKSDKVIKHLQENEIDLIILAGFMWLVPHKMVERFTIVNIHPALLPSYGGKGMYGHHVHEAVLENKEKQSGITIHMVNNEYDKGKIILQQSCPVLPNDTPDSLADRIHKLEHAHYPPTIEKIAQKLHSKIA